MVADDLDPAGSRKLRVGAGPTRKILDAAECDVGTFRVRPMGTAAQTFLLAILLLLFEVSRHYLYCTEYMSAIATQGKNWKASLRPFFMCFDQ
jgi:hypothetical protein